MNPKIMDVYQNVYVKQMEEKRDLINYTAWLQGQYNMESIGAVMSRKHKYPKSPYGLGEKQNALSGEEQFLLWIEAYNQRFDRN